MNAEQQKLNTFERTSCALLFGALAEPGILSGAVGRGPGYPNGTAGVLLDTTPGLAAWFGHISRFGMPVSRLAA